ncbi:MAG: TIGR02588 family protein [Leptolyngbyaceae cyanobacterium CRU_2_3]|nr:TIGR02588 family protein [Leptolyngbyaceae cyanobacterium CRU_2_3]
MKRTLFESKLRYKPRISAEQVTLAIATLIVAAIVGLVLLSWMMQDQSPPAFLVRSTAVREVQGQFYVPFTVTNTGGETATAVQVLAELKHNGETEELAEQQIDFLSSGEVEEGAFIFSQNPRTGELILRVASYSLP